MMKLINEIVDFELVKGQDATSKYPNKKGFCKKGNHFFEDQQSTDTLIDLACAVTRFWTTSLADTQTNNPEELAE